MNAQVATTPVTTTSNLLAHARRAASCLVVATAALLSACDAESDELAEDAPAGDQSPEVEQAVALEQGDVLAPDTEALMAMPEATSLQLWLEGQGYAMVSSDIELSDTDNVIVQFAKPDSRGTIGAAIAFRLSDAGEVLEVAAVIADEPDPSDQSDIDSCMSPAVYHATVGGEVEITMKPQSAGCEIGIFGCGNCLNTGHCTFERRQSYFWGIKFNTCDPCPSSNPNGCCGCLPGHFC